MFFFIDQNYCGWRKLRFRVLGKLIVIGSSKHSCRNLQIYLVISIKLKNEVKFYIILYMSYRCSSCSRCYVDYYRSLRPPHSEVLHHQKNWLLVVIQSFPCRIYVLLLLMKSWKTNLGGVPKRHAGCKFHFDYW